MSLSPTGGDGHPAQSFFSAQPSGKLHQSDAGGQRARGGREHWREEETQQGGNNVFSVAELLDGLSSGAVSNPTYRNRSTV